jgi:hypothetical protein
MREFRWLESQRLLAVKEYCHLVCGFGRNQLEDGFSLSTLQNQQIRDHFGLIWNQLTKLGKKALQLQLYLNRGIDLMFLKTESAKLIRNLILVCE